MKEQVLFVFLAMVISGCLGAPTPQKGEYTANPVSWLQEKCPEGTVLEEYRVPKGDFEWETEHRSQYCIDGYRQEQGPVKSWEDGKLSYEGQYANGTRVGEWTFFLEDGRIEIRNYNSFGEKDGTQYGYFPSGHLEYTKDFTRGIDDGLAVWYYENGLIQEVARFYAGTLHGEHVSFFKDGSIRSESEYDYGRLVRAFNSFSEITFVTSNGDGYVEKHNRDGQLIARGYYENGRSVGCWEVWNSPHYPPHTLLYRKGELLRTGCEPDIRLN